MKILITGATGYIGGRLAPQLARAGHEVHCLTRRPEHLAEIDWASAVHIHRGDAQTVGDLLAAGSEAAVERRLRSYADAGVTDLSIRIVPIGDDREALLASRQRTREYLTSLQGAL